MSFTEKLLMCLGIIFAFSFVVLAIKSKTDRKEQSTESQIKYSILIKKDML